ncbi:hypothetical protein L3Q82_019205, partial [Scortum barcoo]
MSPFLYSLLTHDCRPADSSNTIIKFADDTTVIGLIKDSDEACLQGGASSSWESTSPRDLTWTTGCSKLVKEGSPAPFLPEDSEEEPPVLRHPGELLPLHHRKHPDQLHHSQSGTGAAPLQTGRRCRGLVKAAQRIAGAPLPSIEDIYRKRCLKRAGKIIKDSSHPAHRLFTLLPSGKRYRSARTKTTRFLNSFFPTAVRLLNS